MGDKTVTQGKEKPKHFQRLMEYAGSRRALTYASLALSAVSSLIALVPFVCLWIIIDGVIVARGDQGAIEGLTTWAWWALATAAAALLIYTAGLMCSHLSAFRVARSLRSALMRHIATLPLGVIESRGSGSLRKVVDESSAATETYLAHRLPDKAAAVVTPIGLLALMLVFDWRLGLLSLVPVALSFALMMLAMVGPGFKEKMSQYNDALQGMSNEAVEYVRGMPVIKTFGQTVFGFKRFKNAIDHYGAWALAYTKDLRTPMTLYTTIVNGVFACLIAGALWFGQGGTDQVFLTNLIFYVIITPVIAVTMNKVMFASEDGMIVEDALARIDGILDLQPLPQATAGLIPEDSSINLSNVSFRYSAEAPNAVEQVSLHVPATTTMALVGPSGSGKSTIAALVSRMWDVDKGSVEIGGIDIRDIEEDRLMDQVSVVFQDSKLLKASIADNVRLGRPGASDEEVLSALHDAQCDDILQKLPQGMHTQVGSKGVYLSGGEQQRLALARAFVKDAPILVLDEATAFADPDNETLMMQALERLSKGRTVLKIAHRLSTVTSADCIAVLQEGRIVQQGTHDQLLQQDDSLYATMWSHYLTSAAWTVSREAM